jgi:hypothetical protein
MITDRYPLLTSLCRVTCSTATAQAWYTRVELGADTIRNVSSSDNNKTQTNMPHEDKSPHDTL